MTPQTVCSAFAVMLVSVLTANTAAAQLMSTCVENSPERRGEIGCSIIESKVLPDGLKEPVFWHIDRFDALERARATVGPASIAFEAAGTSWLMTIESQTSDHHGGRHVAHVGPLPLPRAPKYAMMVQSAVFTPGMYSSVHHHSGVEAVYVIDGEAVLRDADTRLQTSEGRDARSCWRHADASGGYRIDASPRPGSHRPRRRAASHNADGRRNRASACRM